MKLGLDIGGTKTAAAIVHTDGRLAVLRTRASGHGPGAVVRVAASLALEAVAAAGTTTADLSFIGACMPGLVDRGSGLVSHAVNLGVERLDLAGRLGAALGQPVAVDNDVKTAALGAHHLLDQRNTDGTLAYLNIGTGLAAALVRNGEVLRGSDGSLGEIGHLPMGGDAVCKCGQRGCLETLVSGSALERMWPPSGTGRAHGRNPFVAADDGDTSAAAAGAQLSAGLFLAVQMLVLTTGADRIVIGGGLTRLGGDLSTALAREIEQRARASEFVASLNLASRIELVPADLPVAALGAAMLQHGPLPTPQRSSGVPA